MRHSLHTVSPSTAVPSSCARRSGTREIISAQLRRTCSRPTKVCDGWTKFSLCRSSWKQSASASTSWALSARSCRLRTSLGSSTRRTLLPLLLASRAEPGAATADARLLDRRPATIARLSSPPVDLELALHRARGAVGRRVIPQRGPLPGDAGAERVADAPPEPLQLLVVEQAGRAERMDARPPEGLVGVDVPEPRHRALVEDRGLHRRSPAGQALEREPALERLLAEAGAEVGLDVPSVE